eukprot:m.116663 g.116663  ORF g.116663 m.116663 type:complete len:314 (-) comp17182_c0_seq2:264-1205(-)
MENTARQARVLSIQSHVVHGVVGNKSAVFPLQVLGFEVDAINSVQFSNHTGYPSFSGGKLSGAELWDIFNGLEANNLADYTHVLTGYMGSVDVLDTVVKIVTKLKEINPSIQYVCDPVMGDNGKLYVPKDLVPRYKNSVIRLADVITPNQFEVELLTEGGDIASMEDAVERMQQLHTHGPGTVVISSLNANIVPDGQMVVLGSAKQNSAGHHPYRYTLTFPRVNGFYFTGTGDLFTALFLAWNAKGKSPHEATEHTIATIQAVIRNTLAATQSRRENGEALSARDRELRLIQSKADIESPDTQRFVSVCTEAP